MWYTHTIKHYLANEKEWSTDTCCTWMNLENIIKRPVTKDYILSDSIYMNAQLNILKSIELYILHVCKLSLNKAIPHPTPRFFVCKSVKLFLKTVVGLEVYWPQRQSGASLESLSVLSLRVCWGMSFRCIISDTQRTLWRDPHRESRTLMERGERETMNLPKRRGSFWMKQIQLP